MDVGPTVAWVLSVPAASIPGMTEGAGAPAGCPMRRGTELVPLPGGPPPPAEAVVSAELLTRCGPVAGGGLAEGARAVVLLSATMYAVSVGRLVMVGATALRAQRPGPARLGGRGPRRPPGQSRPEPAGGDARAAWASPSIHPVTSIHPARGTAPGPTRSPAGRAGSRGPLTTRPVRTGPYDNATAGSGQPSPAVARRAAASGAK